MSTKYGIFDTQDNLWIGDDYGPITFETETIAKVCARVFETRALGTEFAGRYQPKEYPQVAVAVQRDKIETIMTGEQAIRRIEGKE